MPEGSLLTGAEPLSSAALPNLLEMGPGLCHPQGEDGQMAICTQQTPATSCGLIRAPQHPASHGTAAPSFRHHAGQQPGPTTTVGVSCGSTRVWQETARGCTEGGTAQGTTTPSYTSGSPGLHLHFCLTKHHTKAAPVSRRAGEVTVLSPSEEPAPHPAESQLGHRAAPHVSTPSAQQQQVCTAWHLEDSP